MSPDYRVVITEKDGTEIGEIKNYLSIRFEKRLNNYGTCEIKLPLNEPELTSLISLRKYETKIYRDDVLVWAGEQVHLVGTLSKSNEDPVTLTSFDYLELFNSRFTDSSAIYISTDAGAIAWDLINDSQNKTDGDFGVEKGSIETTVDRDRSYYTANIMQSIINLSSVVNGFDFEITDEKIFNVYARKGIDRSSTVSFEYGLNMANNIKIESDFTKPVNQAIALGSGFNENQLREEVTDTASRAVNKLRQGRSVNSDVSSTTTLQEKGQEVITQFKQPLINVSFKQVPNTTPNFGSLLIGDSVRIRIFTGIFQIDNTFRIYGLTVSVSQSGEETIEYLVSLYT